MSQSIPHGGRQFALLASIGVVALLALVTTWMAALARVPQQRAAVERLLRAQTGLDVRYGRLVVRLGFYGPEAEFSNVDMRRPGVVEPLLRAPRMVARFESWRLLRGGQLRPGRVMVTGAEIDLHQLLSLQGAAASVAGATPDPDAANLTTLERLESRLPELLDSIPEGSLDFEAVTLVWRDPLRSVEPLQLRAPRLHASRRIDGAQFSGTLLLPTRLGRTLFVTAQLRNESGATARLKGEGLQGRLRASGRGLVLASWREFGLLPAAITGGSGDLSLAVQLRAGRVQQADGEMRLVNLGVIVPAPVVPRRFRVARGQFSFVRTDEALRFRLEDLELAPFGDEAETPRPRGTLEFSVEPRSRSGSLRAQELPIEAAALVGWLATTTAAGSMRAVTNMESTGSMSVPMLRIVAGHAVELEASWGAAGSGVPLQWHARLDELRLSSADGAWSIAGLGASLQAEGSRATLQLQGREVAVSAPWLPDKAAPLHAALEGRGDFAGNAHGWSLALPELELRIESGAVLQVAGSSGGLADGTASSGWTIALAEPLVRARMATLQSVLHGEVPDGFWQSFTEGRIETGRAELIDGQWRGTDIRLRGAAFAAAPGRATTSALDADLAWANGRVEGRMLGGRVGTLVLNGGTISTPRGAPPATLEVEAQLSGSIAEIMTLATKPGTPGQIALDLAGEAQVEARLRLPAAADPARELALVISVEDARWQPVAEVAALTGLRGRLRADGRGLREGQLDGRWLGGPVSLRLQGTAAAGLRLAASGRVQIAALEREWAWVDLVDRARNGEIQWSAQLRQDAEDGAGDGPQAWQMRVDLPGSARAELRWLPGTESTQPWRIDRGTVALGSGGKIAGIPGALVVGGRLERLELAGLAGALARFDDSRGWQRPLVGEVAVADLRLGRAALGAARLRLAGSRESTSVELSGEALAGELRQVHGERGRLSGRFARLELPEEVALPTLSDALAGLGTTLQLQIAELRRSGRSLGALEGRLESDGAVLNAREFSLRRGSRRASASGRCERSSQRCSGELQVEAPDLGELLQDLGAAPGLRGGDSTLTAKLGWSMQPDTRLVDSLDGEVALVAALDRGSVATDTERDTAHDMARDAAAPAWPLLAPLLAVVAMQSNDPAAASPDFDQLEMRLVIRDGVAELERYEAVGRTTKLSIRGQFDFVRGTLDQQAGWRRISPGGAGAVEQLDPRSPLAATLRTLRTLRDLVGPRAEPASAAQRDGDDGGGGETERFVIGGTFASPEVKRVPLLDSMP